MKSLERLSILTAVLLGLLFQSFRTQGQSIDKNKYIGMPVGGIATGQVYLGGDGQLWYWDIFNVSSVDPGKNGGDRFYMNPMTQDNKFENGFGITARIGDEIYTRRLNRQGFSNIEFNGEYPVGKVRFEDRSLPFAVDLVSYSPFIPTDAENSGLPLVVMEYTVRNTGDKKMSVDMYGWLQNMSCQFSAAKDKGQPRNTAVQGDGFVRVFCDNTQRQELPDWGDMSLTLLGKGQASASAHEDRGVGIYKGGKSETATTKPGIKLVGGVSGKTVLEKGDSETFTFVLSWNFPNVHLWDRAHNWKGRKNLRHYYSSKFKNSSESADYLMRNDWLMADTKAWNRTWYDSSLPRWFLDRTFINVSTLATTASVRFDDLTDSPENEGRFYAYEGVYLGPGTCTHVFHYEQALGRVFPDLAKKLRTQIDLGLSFRDSGVIEYRGEFSKMGHHDGRGMAIDGQAGTVMRLYREHLMSTDNSFLVQNWKKIRQSIQIMIDQDKEKTGQADGILEGKQYNTLDRTWYGKVAWTSGMYAAALRAGEAMANDVGDRTFAKQCSSIAEKAYRNIDEELFNGEYYYQKLDPEHLDAPNTNKGCHIDQLLGQYWASQLGLGYILPEENVRKALSSIVKYNFVDNYEAYLDTATIKVRRYYAIDDESGLIMCAFPRGGADLAPGKINNDWERLVVGYFSEMWTGQEHQVAAALIDEGMVAEGLKVERALHERYSPEKRNPYNEVEYGNHYTRAMSGYAPFVSASGYFYHGPEARMSFSPKMNKEDFRSAFIAAEAWGSFAQKKLNGIQTATLELAYGQMNLKELGLDVLLEGKPKKVTLLVNGKKTKVKHSVKQGKIKLSFAKKILKKGDDIRVEIQA
ncbi:hypothetical protein FUAX_45880 (plasmid) [Fulvitalea axinellae]|uniref:Uncharacterized protein n=1 Tax=Fulvitalea axinellae TaxID=1182444 RepID=A0AAU9CJ64_9BACT|nr:hypothetical protein FUAX_45880 [Fulvitalea axinellae]